MPVWLLYGLAGLIGLAVMPRLLRDPEPVMAFAIAYLPLSKMVPIPIVPGVNGTNVIELLLLYHWFRALAVNTLPVPPGFGLGGLPLSLTLSTAMFFLAYRYLPHRRIGIGPALAGAILASLLWEIAKQLFRLYIQEVSLYNQIYGPLTVLVAFVMFVYYSAIVFVLSGAFVAALDARYR